MIDDISTEEIDELLYYQMRSEAFIYEIECEFNSIINSYE
jgi:hypothetical protein